MAGKKGQNQYKQTKNNSLPDGTVIDLNAFDWGEYDSLLERQKLFVFWFTLPNQDGYRNATAAALKSGYKRNSAYKMRDLIKQAKLAGCIEMFQSQLVKTTVKDAFNKVVFDIVKRATYNVKDFYETKEIENEETGETFNRIMAKSLDDIDPEKASVIDNVEVNQSGIATYKLPVREKEMDKLIKLNKELNSDQSTGDYDVETTVETIRNNLQEIKTTVRVTNQKVRENARNYIENSENQPDYD